MKAGPAAARLGVTALVLLALLAAASVRLVADGRAELAASEAAWKKGDGVGAAVHARNAARAYVPGAAHMELGYERLRGIAESSERRGDTESALFAWRAILSAATGSRPFSAASSEARAAAEAAVARLSAAVLASGRTPSAGRRATAAEATVAADVAPRLGWGALLLVGAGLWWGAGLRLTSRAWSSDGRVVPAQARIAAVMALAGFAAWLGGLLLG